ncbi:hypothetical protein HDU97_004813 [Phlyctochytrium planicorne]|nr:hypothetical protein HDU97_004813 [Phlyctochytrium planicorne]
MSLQKKFGQLRQVRYYNGLNDPMDASAGANADLSPFLDAFNPCPTWTGEKFGGAQKTETSEEFKKLENETEQRREYTDKLLDSCNSYLKTMGKKKDGRDAKLPMEYLASSMINFGSVLDEESGYGRALLQVGESHERIAGLQSTFNYAVQEGFVNHLNEIMGDMKEYQKLKTKLENRRLDFDAKLNRVHKSKKENSVLEEEIRVAQNKYEETLSDTTDKMIALNSNEAEQLHGLLDFVDAEVEYFQNSLQILQKLQADIAELRDLASAKPRPSYRQQSVSTNYEDEADTTHSSHMSRSSSYNTFSERKTSTYAGSATKAAPVLPSRAPASSTVLKQVKVLYDFEAEGPGELSIRSGDIINVTVEIDDGWWEGELTDGSGAGGMFPSNYVEVIDDQLLRAPPMPSRPSSSHSNPPSSTSARGSYSNGPGSSPLAKTPSSVTPPRPKDNGNTGGSGGGFPCSTCSCVEFVENAFKPGQCRTCFHKH